MNHKYPSSLSEYGKIRKSNGKSDVLDCLSKVDVNESFTLHEEPSVDAYVIDGLALISVNYEVISTQ